MLTASGPGALALDPPDTPTRSAFSVVDGGYVRTIVPRGDVTYIGGTFNELAAITGAFARLDAASGRRNALLAEAHGGEVRASVADGNGGYYIGGTFSSLGGEPRQKIGHILADGSVDRSFRADVYGDDSVVHALALSGDGGTLYVGGSFAAIGGQARNNLAAVEAATGRVTSFNPAGLGTDGPVQALEVAGTQVYVGGDFLTLGGQTRNGLAKVAGTTGGDLGWRPMPANGQGRGTILAIEASGDSVYVGGFLHRHRGPGAREPRQALGHQRPGGSGVRTESAGPRVRAPARGPGPVRRRQLRYHRGPLSRRRRAPERHDRQCHRLQLRRLRLRRPRAGDLRHEPLCRRLPAPRRHPDPQERDPGPSRRHHRRQNPGVQPRHRGLRRQAYGPHAGDRRHEHLRGRRHRLREPGHAARHRGARQGRDSDLLHPNAGPHGPDDHSDVLAIAIRDNDIYLGGDFTSMGGQPRNLLAKVSTDGTLDPDFIPNPTGGDFIAHVRAIVVTGTDVYVGGDFSSIGGQPRLDLAKLNPITGQVDGGRQSFDPDPTDPNGLRAIAVGDIQVSGEDVYVAGGFTTIGGLSRREIAKISATTGDADAQFDASISGRILPEAVDIALVRGTLYVAGVFSSIGGAARKNVAALNPKTGAEVTGFNPDVTGSRPVVYDIEVTDDEIYIGGGFDQVGGTDQVNIARLTKTGALTDFDPGLNPSRGAVLALATSGSTLYVAGSFQEVGGLPRIGYAQFTENLPPTALDTEDDVAPASAVQPLDGVQDRALFAVEWAGADEGAGVRDYSVFVATDGGPFVPWRVNTTAMMAMFQGEDGSTYEFYSVARDLMGNLEVKAPLAEAITTLVLRADDGDGDGVADGEDRCAGLALGPTVVVDGLDTGVANAFTDALGCTLADRIGEAGAAAVNLRQFVRRVERLTRSWLRDALIDEAQAEIIRSAAAQATLLPP